MQRRTVVPADEWMTSNQDRQILALREWYDVAEFPMINSIIDTINEPLEKTRIHGPFNLDTVEWVVRLKVHNPEFRVTFGHDADGREYLEF